MYQTLRKIGHQYLQRLPIRNNLFSNKGPKCPEDAQNCPTSQESNAKCEYFEDITTMPASLRAIRHKQEYFQKDDGVPIHLKGGQADKLLVSFTFAMCALGLIGFGKFAADMIMVTLGVKQKPQ